MTVPETVLLQAQQAQLLLYSMGYRRVYGFLPTDMPDRRQSLQLFADLVRKGILQEQGGSLQLQAPWRDCLRHWGEADVVVRLHTADAASPDCCCYPYADGVMVCAPQPRRPRTLRLTCLPREGLWPWMKENYPLPAEEEGTLACEEDGQIDTAVAEAWQNGTAADRLPGFLFLMEWLARDGTPPRQLAAVQRPLYRQLLRQQAGEIALLPYRDAELQRCLQEWSAPQKEKSL